MIGHVWGRLSGLVITGCFLRDKGVVAAGRCGGAENQHHPIFKEFATFPCQFFEHFYMPRGVVPSRALLKETGTSLDYP